MGRRLEFEPSEAVQKAMMVFWQKGFERTSVADLEAGTGVGRKSLYRTFRDKEDLFLAALGNYRRYMADENLAPLLEEDADLDDIEALLHQLASLGGTPEGGMGCLICNTAVEMGQDMPAAARQVDAYFAQIRAAMLNALQGAVSKGQIALPPEEMSQEANFFLGVIQSLCVLGRASHPRETLEDIVNAAIKRLG
ncbi:MAG: TetR/AcrR family transcriptional regulator [Nodosilinea sp.]